MPRTKSENETPLGGKRAYSVDEVAILYGVSRQKIYDEINAGRLHSFKIGNRRLIPNASLDAWEKGDAA